MSRPLAPYLSVAAVAGTTVHRHSTIRSLSRAARHLGRRIELAAGHAFEEGETIHGDHLRLLRIAGALMSEAGVPPRRAQEILGHADVRSTLAICTHSMRRKDDDSADKVAELAGLTKLGNKRETIGSVDSEESGLSYCFCGSHGWNRTNDQRINRSEATEPRGGGRKKTET
jgi:hypothetical protein